ncbi:hypothetical protein AK830_g2633 [Neonectria ditissima]|uniref:Ecp2 effector protein-like domain-containing protein n=1 Tax=Neonectria ditissima TaxID=78410 RepID=A0A0P7BJN9_9HYPO|nr:hypothetical protein AK830_g2633 [Neonectria ditissima]
MVIREVTNSEGRAVSLRVHKSLVADSKKTKRADVSFPSALGPVAFNGNQCGSSSFEATSDDSAQGCNIDDCNDLASGLSGLDRHWELNNGFGGYVKDWVELASAGNCHFYVNRHDFIDATTDGKNFIGTTDVADLVRDSVAKFQKWGTVTYPGGSLQVGSVVPANGHAKCFPNNWDTPWRVQSNQP